MSKRVNLNVIKFDGATDLIFMPIGPDRSKLSFGQDVVNAAEPESPFSVSFWFFTDDVVGSGDDNGQFVGIVDRDPTSLTYAQHEWLLTRQGNRMAFAIYDPENDDGDPDQSGTAIGTKYRFGDHDTVRGLGARLLQITPSVFQDKTWHHAVATYDGSKTKEGQKIYVDGALIPANYFSEKSDTPEVLGGNVVPVGVAPGQFPYEGLRNGNAEFTIGAFGGPAAAAEFSILGSMADVCVFDKALSLAEVQEVYNGGKVKNMTQASTYNNLLAWWKMGDDEDTAGPGGIKDYINSNHGQLEGDAHIASFPSLPSDRIRPSGFINTSWGKTRQPKNVAGDHAVYIHGGISGAMPKTDPSASSDGYATENQRFLHLRWKAEQTNKTHEITAYGYSYASGVWSLLHDTSGTQVKLNTTNEAVDLIRIFQISGIDRVYFKSTGDDDLLETDLFASAVSSF